MHFTIAPGIKPRSYSLRLIGASAVHTSDIRLSTPMFTDDNFSHFFILYSFASFSAGNFGSVRVAFTIKLYVALFVLVTNMRNQLRKTIDEYRIRHPDNVRYQESNEFLIYFLYTA